jgi:hypothetical protein
MTLQDLNAALNAIPGFNKKVAYRAFPVGKAPKLPFICYLCTNTDNFNADDSVYQVIQGVDIELYTAKKDEASERAVEAMLSEYHLSWEKYEEYIDSENCYMITYSIEIVITQTTT